MRLQHRLTDTISTIGVALASLLIAGWVLHLVVG